MNLEKNDQRRTGASTPPPYYGPNNNNYGPNNYEYRRQENMNTRQTHYNDGSVSLTTHFNSVMKRVYVRMFVGLLISAFCALGVASSTAALTFIYGNPIVYWGMFIAMLAMAWSIPARLHKMKTGTCLMLFVLFSALMGCSLSSILIIYSMGSIVSTFFITAGVFGAMSVYGYFTKADLSKMGSFLMMALFGIIIASVVNIFLHSSGLNWAISLIGVVIFIGLTAWDTQQIRQLANANLSPELTDKLATIGALNLYLDFINLFLFLLRIFGGSRD